MLIDGMPHEKWLKDTTRHEARDAALERDGHTCVFCGAGYEKGLTAHHILERKLWEDGGYHLDNLVTVCGQCHLLCEETLLTPEECREMAGITRVIVPEFMYADVTYDKWGNVLLPDGKISRGPLYHDDGCQHNLYIAGKRKDVIPYIKYPRTMHLPWSFPNRDDRVLANTSVFEGQQVIVTEKLDGECTSLYNDFMHARSLSGASHPSQSWVRNFHAKIAHEIPYDFRVCGENVYARHSIQYNNLDTYFYGFSIWDGLKCLSWDDTITWFRLLGVTEVPVLYEGVYDEQVIKSLCIDESTQEGYVVRLAGEFFYKDFQKSVAKYVRKNHVQTKERWDRVVERNHLNSRS